MVADFLWDLEIAIVISSVFEFHVPVHDRSRDIRYRSRYLQLLLVSSFRRIGLADPCSGLPGKFHLVLVVPMHGSCQRHHNLPVTPSFP